MQDASFETTTFTPDAREWALEGVTNFRDLGGLVNRHGQMLQRGRIFRSDNLARLTTVDLERLAPLAIRTLIDLRAPEEIVRSGPSPLLEHGVAVMNLPVVDVDASPDALVNKPLAEMYIAFLEHGQASYRQLFAILAASDDLPAVIHCAAGKDRTGVAAALLFRILEVEDATIVADYAITDRNIARMLAAWAAADPERAASVDRNAIPEGLIRARAETMEHFLTALDTHHGSAENYLLGSGVTSAELAAIRATMLG